MRRLALAPLRFYRRWLSPLVPPRCKYHPTCSAYAIAAIEQDGVARGTLLAGWRLLRCNPFSHGGYDPVPAPRGAALAGDNRAASASAVGAPLRLPGKG